MSQSKLDEIFNIEAGETWTVERAKIDIKLLMLNIYKEALEAGSVEGMSDKFRELVEAL